MNKLQHTHCSQVHSKDIPKIQRTKTVFLDLVITISVISNSTMNISVVIWEHILHNNQQTRDVDNKTLKQWKRIIVYFLPTLYI